MSLKSGDILSFHIEEKNKYTAFQVVSVDEQEKTAELLLLDYYADKPISRNDFAAIKPYWRDHHAWQGGYESFGMSGEMPAEYTPIGNRGVLVTEELKSEKSSWFPFLHIVAQKKWNALPQDVRERYKRACDSNEKVAVGGKEYFIHNSRVPAETMANIRSGDELDQLPHLSEIYANTPHDWLLDYVRKNPLLYRLIWRNHGLASIDVRDSALTFLSVSTEGVRDLYLNSQLEELSLNGKDVSQLTIHPGSAEQSLHLYLHDSLPADTMKHLAVNALWLHGMVCVDMQQIYDVFPNLKVLRIWGKPGTVENIRVLGNFKKLSEFSLYDIFGFSADEFPAPEKLPALSWLWLTSIPAEAAKQVKAAYGEKNINLRIAKPRKVEWLEENLGNPFRDWDGADDVAPAHAKKAASLFKNFKRQIHLLGGKPVSHIEVGLRQAMSDFTAAFNKMDRRTHWIETTHREEIADVVGQLIAYAKKHLGTTVDGEELFKVFDVTRDF